jgi:ABC-type transport system substrate-binding protein
MTDEGNYWNRTLGRRTSRRGVIRAGGLVGAGLAGAALIGCGDDDDDAATPGAPGTTPAAPQTPDDEVKRGGRLRQLVGDEIPNMDLPQHSSPFVVNTVNPQYDQLVQWDPFQVGNIIPNLAHSFEWPDESTLVFNLNEAQFHNGQEFTSEDVVNSLDRIKNPPEGVISPRQAQLGAIESIDTPDDRTAVLNLNRPSASMIPTLAGTEMIMRATEDLLGDFDYLNNSNGTGPFKFQRWDRGARLIIERNPNYYEEGLPYLDEMEFIFITDPTQQIASFRGGEVDIAGIPAVDRASIEQDPDFVMLSAPGTATWVTVINTTIEPWTDDRTWHAAALAIDKDDANQVISEGRGFTHHAIPPVPPWELSEQQLLQVPGYKGLGDGQESSLDARRQEARALFAAAGIEGYEFDMFTWNIASFENWALVMQDGLEQAGLRMRNLELTDRGTYEQRLAALTYGDFAAASRGATFPDPSPAYADSYITGSGRLYTGLTHPDIDDLYLQQEAAVDPEERLELVHRMFMRHLEIYPAEISHFLENALGLQLDVHGYGELYGGFFQSRKMQYAWLDR